jgi:hypothetical protein
MVQQRLLQLSFPRILKRAPGFYYIYGAWTEYTITTGNGYNGWYYSNTSPISGSTTLSLYDAWRGTNNSYDYGSSYNSIAYTTAKIDATGYTNLKLNFKWRCGGDATFDYGEGCLVYKRYNME